MAFVPKNANGSNNTQRTYDPNRKYPTPKSGSRPARVSLVVDLGVQEREDFEDEKTGEKRPQKPCQQVAVFCDLVNDVVDYGGEIGVQAYRLALNKSFGGEFQGINFTAIPVRDPEGNVIKGKPWTFPPASTLTKLCKATGKLEVIESQDLEQLLDQAFMATVEVRETESKTIKDDAGNPVKFTNTNFKGCSEIPLVEGDDGVEKPMRVKQLASPALCITFDTATPEQVKFLRKNIINMIKLAKNYPGSQMQKAIEQFEASKNAQQDAPDEQGEDFVPEAKETPKPAAKKAPVAAKKAVEPVEEPEDFDDSDSPFN